jgi:8-oxo-dGTP pyrophosphatase MutT (NUDIX family)
VIPVRDTLAHLDARGRPPDPGRFPDVKPKDAATLIIIDRSGGAPKVLLGRRHEGHVFMPGKFVFPGGRVEASDRVMHAASELDPAVQARLAPSAAKARALALAAVRETFEETGLMLGVKGAPGLETPGGLWSAFAEAGVYPDLAAMHFVARAVTPPGLPRRFDTRFFAVDAQAVVHRVDGIIGPQAELVELLWAPISETGPLGLMAITEVVLWELEARAAAGMGHHLPVPFFRVKNGRHLRELL